MTTEIDDEIAVLQRMTSGQLRERYAELFGEHSRSHNTIYLVRKIAWRLQSQSEGELSVRARRKAAELANECDLRLTPPKTRPMSTASIATVKLEVPA